MAGETGRALHPRDAELTALVKGAGARARRAAAFAAKTALQVHPVPDHPVSQALDALERGDDSTALGLRDDIDRLVTALDGAYFDRSAAAGPENDPDLLAAFARARAVNALAAALAPDPVQATLDAIYEAHGCLPYDRGAAFVDAVKDLLRQLQAGE